MSNRIYEQIQAYSKELIETENYRVWFMNHVFVSNNGFYTREYSPDIFYGRFPELEGKFTEDEDRIIASRIHNCWIDASLCRINKLLARNFEENENEDRSESRKKS